MAYLYKSHSREMRDKFLQEGSSMAEPPCERTKQGFKSLYNLCIQDVKRMGFANSITILHTVEALSWKYLWVEPFPYEVPELQDLYEEWRASEADAKAVLDAAFAGLGDTPPPETPRALLQNSFIFRDSSQPAREITGNALALKAPPNTRTASPLFNPTNSPFKNNPATPPPVKVKTEHDEKNTDWIKHLTSQLSPKAEDKAQYNRYQLRHVRGMTNINARLTPKIPSAKKDTPKKSDQHLPGSGSGSGGDSAQPRALRSRNEPLYALYDNRGKARMAPVTSIETPLKASLVNKTDKFNNTPEMEKESPNTMQGVMYTSPEPPVERPRRPIHPLLVNTKHAIEKRKQLHPDPELAMATPSNGFHLRKRPKHQTPF